MKLLAIDTSADRCAACVLDTADGSVHAVSRRMERGHAEALIDVIAECLSAAAARYDDFERIAVTVGPGSFTGVRVGVATARGLALALDIPALGVTTLEALAAAARAEHPDRLVLVVNDAGREQVYAGLYDTDGEARATPQLADMATAAELATAETVLAGSAAPALIGSGASFHAVTVPVAAPPIRFVAECGARKPAAERPRPLYLRAPDAKPQAGFALPRQVG